MHQPLIIGHRGAAGEAPENTLASFQLALQQGCDGIELDVHLSADGQILVCHDATIDRTTNGTGVIREMTAVEIREYDAGSYFDERFTGERVPLLGEVFELVPPHLLINIEIKHSYEGHMEAAVLAFLRERNRLDNVVISSFDHKCIQRVKAAEPEVKVGLLYAANLLNHAGYAQTLDVEVHSLHPQHAFIGKEDVEEAVQKGLSIYPYTANQEKDLNRLIDAGVTGIITDYPARLASLLRGKM